MQLDVSHRIPWQEIGALLARSATGGRQPQGWVWEAMHARAVVFRGFRDPLTDALFDRTQSHVRSAAILALRFWPFLDRQLLLFSMHFTPTTSSIQ